MDKLRYPIGQFNMSEDVGHDQVENLIAQIEVLHRLLAESLKDLSESQKYGILCLLKTNKRIYI